MNSVPTIFKFLILPVKFSVFLKNKLNMKQEMKDEGKMSAKPNQEPSLELECRVQVTSSTAPSFE